SRIALQDSFARGTLVPLAVPQRDLSRAFYFILRRDKYLSEGIKKWLELCRRPVASS
ncbi:MAG: hypothetical protein ACI9WS_001015, partial [Paraglaciecola psychrophila]